MDPGKVFRDKAHNKFQKKWEKLYFFVPKGRKAVCLICRTPLAYFKKSNLEAHFMKHEEYHQLTAEERAEEFERLYSDFRGDNLPPAEPRTPSPPAASGPSELPGPSQPAPSQELELPGPSSLLASEPQTSGESVGQPMETEGATPPRPTLPPEEPVQYQAQEIRRLKEEREELKRRIRGLTAQVTELGVAKVSLAEQRQAVKELEQQLQQSDTERRALLEIVHELKGNNRVICRVRPLLASEQGAQTGMGHLYFPPGDKKTFVLSRPGESHVGHKDKDFPFTFDRIFPPSASQEEVFEEVALLVQSALDGHHVCIFAYGQTETYTMEEVSPDTAGLIPRAVQQVFRASREMKAKGWTYHFQASYLEIYNEALRDLLVPPAERSSELEIRLVNEDTREVQVPGLSCFPVALEEEVLELLQRAEAQRATAETSLNERSARSHGVLQLRIEGRNASRELRTSAVLNLVDLAGSEPLDKSQPTQEQEQETQAINKSLSALSLVITALNKGGHVPYSDSKLTDLLQEFLGGSSKTLMLVNISPSEENLAESLRSLRIADLVMKDDTAPVKRLPSVTTPTPQKLYRTPPSRITGSQSPGQLLGMRRVSTSQPNLSDFAEED